MSSLTKRPPPALRAITPAEKALFAEDGVVVLRNILNPRWVEHLRSSFDNVLARPSASAKTLGQAGDKFSFDISMWTFDEGFREFQANGPTPRWASEMLGSDKVFLIEDALFAKEPNSSTHTPWHHDQPYLWLNGSQVCSFWIPLDEVTIQSGAVEWIPGSHRWGKWFQPPGWQDTNSYANPSGFEVMPDFESEREKHRIVHFDTAPGDVIAHHLLTMHHAPGNSSSNRRRRAVATRYAGEDVTYVERPGRKPIRNPGLKTGDKIESDLFPRVWPRPTKGLDESVEAVASMPPMTV